MSEILKLEEAFERLDPELTEQARSELARGVHGIEVLRPRAAALLMWPVKTSARWRLGELFLAAQADGRLRVLIGSDATADPAPLGTINARALRPGDIVLPGMCKISVGGERVKVLVEWQPAEAAKKPPKVPQAVKPAADLNPAERRDEFIRDRIAAGEVPGHTIAWGVFHQRLLDHCRAKDSDRGFSQGHVERLTRAKLADPT